MSVFYEAMTVSVLHDEPVTEDHKHINPKGLDVFYVDGEDTFVYSVDCFAFYL